MSILIKTRQDIIEENDINSIGTDLLRFIRKALPINIITNYEAFQLMEMSNRYRHTDERWSDIYHIIESFNLALCAKLFDEEDMYNQFSSDAKKKLNCWISMLKKGNNGDFPKLNHYITDDLDGFLSCDIEHLERLSYIRKHATRVNPGTYGYHFECFPYDNIIYEDELLKIANGEISQYILDKSIRPEICEMMIAIELRADELN